MTTFIATLMALVVPFAIRAIIGLGFTLVTFTGVNLVVTQLVTAAQSSWAAMPTAVLQLAALSGIPEVLGMLFGAMAAVLALKIAAGGSRYVAKAKPA